MRAAAWALGAGLAIGAGLTAFAEDSPPSRSDLRAEVFRQAPTIDGVLQPGEWSDERESTFRIERAEQCLPDRRAKWKGPLDVHVIGHVGVDAEALYLAFQVTDDGEAQDHRTDRWFEDDSIEVFLDTDLADADPKATEDPTRDVYTNDDWQIFFMPWNPQLHWGVGYHGKLSQAGDGGLVGLRMAFQRKDSVSGSYTLEARLPLANFPGLATRVAREEQRIGFDVAINDVDRFVVAPDAAGGSPGRLVADPATYLTWNGRGELYLRPSHFGVLTIPAKPAAARPSAAARSDDGGGFAGIVLALLAAAAIVAALLGPGSRRLARVGPRPKAVLLALDAVLAGFLLVSSGCRDRSARDAALREIDDAATEAYVVAKDAAELGALDVNDADARSRTLRRLLSDEKVPCLPAVRDYRLIRLTPWPGEPGGASTFEDHIELEPGASYDWPLPVPVEAQALRVRLIASRDAAGARIPTTGAVRLGVLHAIADGAVVDRSIDVQWPESPPSGMSDGAATAGAVHVVTVDLQSPTKIERIKWSGTPGSVAATLVGIVAVAPDGATRPLVLAGITDDRVPVLTRPGVTPGGAEPFLGVVIPPQIEQSFDLPALQGADHLWLAVTVERGFPRSMQGQDVAEVRVEYADGRSTATRLRNGEDVDDERIDQAIRHSGDMRSRVAYQWTDGHGVRRHHDLVPVALDWGRRAARLVVKNLSPTGEPFTGALTIASATLSRHATDLAGGRLVVSLLGGSGEHRAELAKPSSVRHLLEPSDAESGENERVVRRSVEVGLPDRLARLTLTVVLPAEVAARAERTQTALLTCLAIAAFLLVLIVVDAVERFRRLSARLVIGVVAASLLPLAATVILADRRNADRLETEREARVRDWLAATRGAILGAERQEARVGAQGLLQLVTSSPGADERRLTEQVKAFRRSAMSGGKAAADATGRGVDLAGSSRGPSTSAGGGAWGILVRGRDVGALGTIVVDPATKSSRIDGPAHLMELADAPGLYVSPWDGLLLAASARSVGDENPKKVVVAIHVDEEFVRERVAPALLDREAEVAIVSRDGEPIAGPGAEPLARAAAARVAELEAGSGDRDAVLYPRLLTDAGERLALVAPLPSANKPDSAAAWLVVGVARGALDARMRSLREELIALGLAAAALVACVAATFARRVAGPVRDLVAVTEAVRRGEFDVAVPPPGTDEVGDLAIAFDQMRRDLKHRVGDLDFLRRAQDRVAASLDLARTAEEGLAVFCERYAPDLALFLLALSPSGPVTVRAEHGRKTSAIDRPIEVPSGGWIAEALASAEPLVVSDVAADPRTKAEATAAARLVDDRNAIVLVPLRAGSETQGLVVLAWPGAAALPSSDARALMTPLAGVVALALHNARLYRLAALDEGTTLPGATSFEAALRRDVEAALAGGSPVAVLRIGLDGLERVTQRRGVEAGRALVRAAADALRSALGGRMQAGRIREDELAVRAPGATRDEAMSLASSIRERLAAVEIRSDEGEDPIRTGVSVGVARCPDDAKSVEFLLDAAGRALHAARRDGGDRVVDVHRVETSLVDAPPFEDGAVFRSERMVRVLETSRRAARTDSTVLITGETGVGKEVIADLIHRRSLRAERAFVKVNSAAFPETLLESELFGHERGAFTGAEKRREGRFELADGGTLFLDEVGEMPLAAQVKLLRVLSEGQFTRLGGTKPVSVDVRVIAATNEDLEKAVTAGRFREDLYYRLNVLRIELPSLRERREEIPSLVEHFLADARRKIGRGPARLSSAAMDVLYRHPWPGNVRELRNVIERTVVMCEAEEAGPEHLRLDPPRTAPGAAPGSLAPVAAPMDALNERQRAFLDHLAKNGRATNREFIELAQSSERTGLRDLHDLMKRGLVVREGKRRGAVYRLP